jgi:hypothetical protein
MGICWYCYWGWPKPVAAIYDLALAALGGNEVALEYGAGHIVWSDENFQSAESCLEHFDDYSGLDGKKDLDIVRLSLIALAAIPLEIRCPEPDDYDGENPELFPPPVGVEMVREK